MAKFVLAYHGSPQFETKEAGQAHMQAWMAWVAGLGAAMSDNGQAVGASKTITSDQTVLDHGGENPLSGYSVLEADDIDAAIAMVKPCPHLSAGGSIEIAPALDMEM